MENIKNDNTHTNAPININVPINTNAPINTIEQKDEQKKNSGYSENEDINKLTHDMSMISIHKQKDIRVLCIGDPHFKVGNVKETDMMTQKLVEKIPKMNIDLIVVLGDILDRFANIHESPLRRATYFLKQLTQFAPVYVLIGNHDRPNNANYLTDQHPFNALKYWDNITLADTTIETLFLGHRFILVPYVSPGRFEEALSTINEPLKGTTAIFAHQEFYGAKMGIVNSLDGDKWPLENPLVISGHIHDFDELQNNIYYVGTPIQHGYNDRDDKTVSVFTFCVDGHFSHERVDLGVVRKKIVRMSPNDVVTYTPPDNMMIKLVIEGTSAELKAISKLSKLKELANLGVKIAYKHIDDIVQVGPMSIVDGKPITYVERFYNEVSKDEEQVKLFHKLFGTIDAHKLSVIN